MYVNGIPRKLSEEFELKKTKRHQIAWATTDLKHGL